ncbi:MAG: acyl-CoA dehydrogenase family protein [Pseudomonadota bacterium]
MSVLGNTAINFDDEQAMLLEYATNFCDAIGVAEIRARLEEPQPYPADTWQQIVELGWPGIGIPEELGGSGIGISAAVPVIESMGKVLLGTPLMSSLLTAQLVLRADREAGESLVAAIAGGSIGTVAALESEDWATSVIAARLDANGQLSGAKRFVANGLAAQWIIAAVTDEHGNPALAVIDASGVPATSYRELSLIDLTQRAVDMSLDGLTATQVLRGPGVEVALRDYRLLGALFVAADATGAAASCLRIVVDYLTTRKQFDKLIGSYQALKHPSVEILNQVESSRSFIYHAATLVDAETLDRQAEVACRMAKAKATDTLAFAGDRAVQFHGGMGFTWDCDAQLYIRHAQWAQQQFGDAQHHRQALAPLLLDD